MKTRYTLCLLAALLCARTTVAQDAPTKRAAPAGDYATDLATVGESQEEALEQAKQMWGEAKNSAARDALQTAIKEMERANKLLESAKKNPAELPGAVAAEQAAYQALLKLVPHEFQVNRSRRGKSGKAGQPGERQMEQLELTPEEQRYETERQAAATPTGAQKEQLEAADRLKQLAQRQQDLNDRLRELQTALQQAHTEKEKEEIQRELKHLADEERQMLSDVDDLRQKLDQAPSSSALSQAARDLDKTREETQQAAQQLANQSVSQALASGTRAEQSMENTRENLRSQTSSQFSNQMRQLRDQARDLAKKEDEIARGLESMDNEDHKTLDNTPQRQQLAQQMAHQQSALTNLLAGMQDVSEKAESSEPLLSEQLYDTLRHASQLHTESLLETGGELMDRGFLTKAAEVESSARTNINDLRQRVEHAAESVLGSQSQALRFAQSELDDLAKQVERGLGKEGTNSASGSGAGTNSASLAEARTNSTSSSGGGANPFLTPNAQSNATSRSSEQGNASSQSGEQGNATPQQSERGDASSQSAAQAQGNSPSGAEKQSSTSGAQGGADGGAERLRQLVQQIGGAHGGDGLAGPIVGDDFRNWTDRMRDVEQVVDSVELRGRLAMVRERVAAYRSEYKNYGRLPLAETVKTQVLQPMTEVRAQLQEDLARLENVRSLVPLDHDPVPDNYSELVRKYYEKLGGGQ
ncbi:MAG TPA: hypothetical protein VGR14_02130 [Verrucomicrobiae bacterium]|jgi:hypothetical protein|nr:hypothetical protein [Verrucomicrobiae bacterium]